MLVRRKRMGIFAVFLLSCFLLNLTPALASNIRSDAQQVATAKAALAAASTLDPVEKVNTNVVPMAQTIVNKVSSGVIVTVYRSRNAQVSKTGVVSYSSTVKTGTVTFKLTKRRSSALCTMMVVIPATSTETPPPINQDQAAPTGLAGTAPTSAANNDGKITGVTTAMEYKPATAATYTAVTGNEITGLAAGTYQVRYAAKTGYNAGAATDVVVPVATVKTMVNVKDYGAKGDGVTDDTKAIQNAANFAKNNGMTLYIPQGRYVLNDYLNIYTSVECQGTLLMQNAIPTKTIYIARTVNGTQLNPSSLSGLTRGSSTITGLSGYENGTLELKSTEVLIKRWQGSWGTPYPKTDTSEIINSSGRIFPALDSTYTDMSKLTATVYPYEAPIVINGLAIEMVGDTQNWGMMVKCNRSNVTFNNFKFTNQSTVQSPSYVMQIYDCHDITINNPQITGIFGDGDKYGIDFEYGSTLTVDGGFIGASTSMPGHAITGGNNKNVVVKNGTYYGYKSAVDSHWGNGMTVENCFLGSNEGSGLAFAGTDATISNCTVSGASEIFTLRMDTPDLMGKVVVEDVKYINPPLSWCSLVLGAQYNGSNILDYGHPLQGPDSVLLKNIEITLPASNYRAWYGGINSAYQSLYTGKITTSNIFLTNGIGTLTPNFNYYN